MHPRSIIPLRFALLMLWVNQASANPRDVLLGTYRDEARKNSAMFQEFTVERGQRFYRQEHPSTKGPISCASCHTLDPRKAGQTHAGKAIEAMAPSVNPQRLTDRAKLEKWFTRNCDDVLKRPCTAQEKGDFITYLLSLP